MRWWRSGRQRQRLLLLLALPLLLLLFRLLPAAPRQPRPPPRAPPCRPPPAGLVADDVLPRLGGHARGEHELWSAEREAGYEAMVARGEPFDVFLVAFSHPDPGQSLSPLTPTHIVFAGWLRTFSSYADGDVRVILEGMAEELAATNLTFLWAEVAFLARHIAAQPAAAAAFADLIARGQLEIVSRLSLSHYLIVHRWQGRCDTCV